MKEKVLCIVSHEVPLGPGQFNRYETGKVYEVANPSKKFFKLVGKTKEAKKK